jgi:hypothetical protein
MTALPFLEYCISHSFGVVYQLCWCPSNAWDKSNSEDEVITITFVDLYTSYGLVSIMKFGKI